VPIALEVRPAGGRAGEPPYTISTTMAHLGSGPA
jgi:hypothetical protein